MATRFAAAFLLGGLAFATPVPAQMAAQPLTKLPPNTIRCTDWIQNPNGSWFSHTYASPFTVSNSALMSLPGAMIYKGSKLVGSPTVDLWDVLNMKCGSKSNAPASNPSTTTH